MLTISNVETFGFRKAISSMRNPYMSHAKSDSMSCEGLMCGRCPHDGDCPYGDFDHRGYSIGEEDMKLAKKLIKAGSEHRKFLRMIHVQADVVAPRYWWAEMDKYKWVEANSSSTMHLITKRHLKTNDFSTSLYSTLTLETIIGFINKMIDRLDYEEDKETKDGLFIAIKQLLPESYNQLRTIDTNYECLLSVYHQRHNHRLEEWSGENGFCAWIKSLPYMNEFLEA